METLAQKCARLVTALVDLGAQEAASLAAGDYATLASLQACSAPLIDFLVAHPQAVGAGAVRRQLSAWLAQRQETSDRLARQITLVKGRLEQIETSRRRMLRMAPVYQQRGEHSRRLQAVG